MYPDDPRPPATDDPTRVLEPTIEPPPPSGGDVYPLDDPTPTPNPDEMPHIDEPPPPTNPDTSPAVTPMVDPAPEGMPTDPMRDPGPMWD